MSKRTPAIRWARSIQRNLTALSRASLRAGTRALKASAPRAAPRRAKTVVAPGWSSGVAVGSGGTRGFELYTPPGVRRSERLPLMVMLHGCTQDARAFAAATRMNRVAARERFIVLYPEQARVVHAQRCWHWYDTRAGIAQREAAVLLAAIDQVCRNEPVDADRIAIAGFSAGAGMAALLACRHPERFGAVAMHSGVAPGLADSTASALAAMRGRYAIAPQLAASATIASEQPLEASAATPLLVIQGTTDHVVVAANGRIAADAWADSSGAAASVPRTVRRGARYPMTITDYRRRGRVLVQLCEIERLGHAWSGGASGARYSDPAGPDAARMIWAFASRQFTQAASRASV